MRLRRIRCAYCGQWTKRRAGDVNRAKKINAPLYCDKACAGLGRRKYKTKAQLVEEKRIYDAGYRKKNIASIKAKKAAYFRRTYDPVKAAVVRKKRMKQHVEYCRRPEYKRYKQKYDRQHRALEYGPFAEAYLLALDLNREIKGRMTNAQIKQENQTNNKTLRRARACAETRTRNRNRASLSNNA